MTLGLGREGARKGGAGGDLGGTLAAVGKGAPVVAPCQGDESANGRPIRGGWPGGFRGWDTTSMIIYGRRRLVLPAAAGMFAIAGARAVRCCVAGAWCCLSFLGAGFWSRPGGCG